MSAEIIHSITTPNFLPATSKQDVAIDVMETPEQVRPVIEAGAYMVKDRATIDEARRLTANVYLKRGFIDSKEIGEDGTITPEFDPYIDSSSYYIVANEESQIVATTRKIRYDETKGEESFPVWKSKELFDKAAVDEIESIGLENCVEISALAKELALDTDNLAALKAYRSIFQDAINKKEATDTQETVFLMALSPKLFEQFKIIFKSGLKKIGPSLDYPGEEVIPAIIKPVEGIVETIDSISDESNPDAETNAFVIDFLLEGCTAKDIDQRFIEALKRNNLHSTLNKLESADALSITQSSVEIDKDEVPEGIEQAEYLVGGGLDGGNSPEKRSLNQKWKVGAVVGAALVALAFQQSPGNEAVRTATALNVLEMTENEVAVAGAVGGLTMAIEGSTSLLIALGLHQKKSAVKRVMQRFKRKSAPNVEEFEESEEHERSFATKSADMALALSIGPGIAMTKRHLQEKQPTLKKDIRRGLGYSAVGSVVSGGVGYLVAGGIQQAEKIGLEKPAEYIVTYGTDWKFWASAIVGGYGAKWTKDKFQKLRSKER